MVKLADTMDLGSIPENGSGFESPWAHQLNTTKMLFASQSPCFRWFEGPRTKKSEGLQILLFESCFSKPEGFEPTHREIEQGRYPRHPCSDPIAWLIITGPLPSPATGKCQFRLSLTQCCLSECPKPQRTLCPF